MKSRKGTLLTILMILFVIADVALLLFVFFDPGAKEPTSETVIGPDSLTAVVSDSSVSGGDVTSAADAAVSSADVASAADVPEVDPNAFSYSIYNIGDTFTFGTFEQDNKKDNGPEPIEWLVMDKSDSGLFVVSKYALEPVQYYTDSRKYKYTTWEESLIRAHLNGDFYTDSFTDEERAYIALTHVVNDDNPDFGTEGGNPTEDYIFFLSHDEAVKYFPNDKDRKAAPTKYALKKGAFDGGRHTYWWLRTPGKFRCNAEYVFQSGRVYTYGSDVGHSDVCSRPAMWINFLPVKK